MKKSHFNIDHYEPRWRGFATNDGIVLVKLPYTEEVSRLSKRHLSRWRHHLTMMEMARARWQRANTEFFDALRAASKGRGKGDVLIHVGDGEIISFSAGDSRGFTEYGDASVILEDLKRKRMKVKNVVGGDDGIRIGRLRDRADQALRRWAIIKRAAEVSIEARLVQMEIEERRGFDPVATYVLGRYIATVSGGHLTLNEATILM